MTDVTPDPLDLDTDTPVCDSFFVDRDTDMFHMHGGVVTRVLFSNVEEMSIDALRKELDTPVGDDQLMTVRSTSGRFFMMLRGDKVIRYNGCTFQDCLCDQMQKHLTSNTGITYTPMSQYPLIHAEIKGAEKHVTVRVPKHKIVFKGDMNLGNIEDEITLPDLWFNAKLSLQNSVMDAHVAVEAEQSPDPKECKLRILSFPNTYSDGAICYGGTRTTTQYDKMTEGMAVSGAISRLFNSIWNNHVLSSHSAFLNSCRAIYDKLPVLENYETAIRKCSSSSYSPAFLRYLRILHEPDGYMRVDLPYMNQTSVQKIYLSGL